MIRRFNYTDRQKIPREQVSFTWIENHPGPLQFRAEIDLDLPGPLDPTAQIWVEAYSGPVVMRFSFGTIGLRAHPHETELSEFPPGLKPLFRVKVVEAGEKRRILAWADAITPLSPDEVKSGKRSILPVETLDISPQVWKLRIESNQFRLQLNSAIKEPRPITLLAQETDFIALVYPAVIRQILKHLLLGPEANAVEPDHDWLIFGGSLANAAAPSRALDSEVGAEDEEYVAEVEEWVEAAVCGFCQRQNCAEGFIASKKEAEENRA